MITLLSLIFGLASLSLIVTVERGVLLGRDRKLRAKEYCYRFHALRDELQIMALNGTVETGSLTYSFLMQSLNLAIRNAGTMKLREVLGIANKIKERVEATRFEAICADIARHDSSVGELAGRVFRTFAQILIANDRIICAGIMAHRAVKESWSVIRPALRWIDLRVASVFRIFTPARVDAVDRARQYQYWASRVGSC